MNAIYNKIGQGYNIHRAADSRIVNLFIDNLNQSPRSIIAEIGAGTCNYAIELCKQNYLVKAIEPSEVMREQVRMVSNLELINGLAEKIPLRDNSVNAVYNMLSFHHFSDRQKAADEMMRICQSGPILIFTFDPRLVDGLWFAEYFPTVWQETYDFFPPIEEISNLYTIRGRQVEIKTFALPNDMTDIFAGAAWNRPEMYLNPAVRSGISSFKLSDKNILANNLEKFEQDLKNKTWDDKYGWLRSKNTFDVGYRLICINN